MNLSNFVYKEVDCFQWFTKKNVYFLEVLLDEMNERNKNNFWKVLEQCLCSISKNIGGYIVDSGKFNWGNGKFANYSTKN